MPSSDPLQREMTEFSFSRMLLSFHSSRISSENHLSSYLLWQSPLWLRTRLKLDYKSHIDRPERRPLVSRGLDRIAKTS